MEVSKFAEKLNKVDGNTYVVDEAVYPVEGVYEAELAHDNVIMSTLSLHTGPKLTGEKIETYTVSTPSMAPWKRVIRVYSDADTVYISYETDGDTVEADDINRLQAAVIQTQEALNTETDRAEAAEQENVMCLTREISRAIQAEDDIRQSIDRGKPIWEDKYTRNEVDYKFSTIPKATKETDGLLSKEDKINYDDANAKKHSHDNKSVLDKITQTMLDYLSSAYAHISDAVKHITPAERTLLNTVANKVDKIPGKQLSTNDYTTAEKDKLDKIAAGAEINVQADWYVTDTAADSYIKNKPTAMPSSDVPAWAKVPTKPVYGWAEITDKPSTFNPVSHSHTKGQVGLGNVENKSGAVIRSELTKAEVVSALGYTPADTTSAYRHPDSGVAAGTYRSVTVDAKGHVISGGSPTTLSGYGITDAVKKGPTWNGLMGV